MRGVPLITLQLSVSHGRVGTATRAFPGTFGTSPTPGLLLRSIIEAPVHGWTSGIVLGPGGAGMAFAAGAPVDPPGG